MDADTAKKLREPFPDATVGKLPRVTCKACSNSPARHCDRHERKDCKTCGNWISTAHMHLDYVGHAAITDRLLQVDPTWSWEPVAFNPNGLPALDGSGGLWIRLTVAGVTRLGYGDAEGKTGPSAMKEAIGDALRNAAMRFGVGLDLWHKDGQLAQDDEPTPPASGQASNGSAPSPPIVSKEAREALEELAALCDAMSLDRELVAAEFARRHNGADVRKASTPGAAGLVRAFIAAVDDMDPTKLKRPVAATNGVPA
jgi:hypothetical protein